MNEVPSEVIFNWDQMALHLVSTGQWTMHRAREKVITISNSDDKRQVTAVFAATLTGDFLAPQIIYKGKTQCSHPKVSVPSGWDLWHSDNHWSNEETVKRYVEKTYLDAKRVILRLSKSHPAHAIFDCFRGQATPEFLSLLKVHNIVSVQVAASCTDRLQPLDVSVNMPIKDD